MNIANLLLAAFTIVELNCENLFDTQHDSLKNDYEFLPQSERKWTPQRYWNKLNDISKELLSCGDKDHLPDIIALTEVENDSVMHDLCHRSLLRNAHYEYIMTHCDDPRGIDVALMYQPNVFHVFDTLTIRQFGTRDVLCVRGETRNADTLNIFIVHLPSRLNNSRERELQRCRITDQIAHSPHIKTHGKVSAIVLGDFNEYTGGVSLQPLLDAGFTDITANAPAKGDKRVKGTYKYNGRWGSLDHILIRGDIQNHVADTFINAAPFLLQYNKNGEIQPRRTYRGTFYQGGYSDHLPLVLTLSF